MAARADVSNDRSLSRRALLRGAGSLTGSIAVAGLSGCSPQRSKAPSDATATQPPVAAASAPARPLAADAVPAWRAAMQPRTWAKVGNPLGDIDPARDPALNPNFPREAPWRGVGGFSMIVAAWSGAAYHRETDTLRLMGGGHADYAGNELPEIGLAVERPAWRLEMPPTPRIGGDDGEARNTYPDGRPRSSHTYNQVCWVGADFYLMQGSQWRSGNAGNRLFRYRAGVWTDLGVNPHASWIQLGALCHDEQRHQLLWLGYTNAAPMVSYDIATGAWKALTANNQWSITGGTPRLVRVPHLDVVVSIYGDGFGVFDYGRTPMWGFARPPVVGTPPPPMGGAWRARTGEWVPELGAIVQWDGASGFHTLTPPAANPLASAWTWGRIEAVAGTASAPVANGTFGRFFYSPRLRAFGVANGGPVDIFALGRAT